MIDKTIITECCDRKKIIRGYDPFAITFAEIDIITDAIVDECFKEAKKNPSNSFDYTWSSVRTLKKRNLYKKFKPIPKLQRVSNQILQNINDNFNIKLKHTLNGGPEYQRYIERRHQYRCDYIRIPEPERFLIKKQYYNTLLHELSHAACSDTRLSLKFNKCEEEISVEASALIICFMSGYNLWNNSLAYITEWSYNDDGLYLRTKTQWDDIKRKTKRIVKYLLSGKDQI